MVPDERTTALLIAMKRAAMRLNRDDRRNHAAEEARQVLADALDSDEQRYGPTGRRASLRVVQRTFLP